MKPIPPNMERARPDDVMRESYTYWTQFSAYGNFDHDSAVALVAMGAGETSFRWSWRHIVTGHFYECVVGDHGHAFGEFQHQRPRCHIIEAAIGIDITATAIADPKFGAVSHSQNLEAADWEISDRLSFGYKKVRPALIAAQTPHEKVAVLVHLFEGSAKQERDTFIRFALFNAYSERLRNGSVA
jgi:hypothetical protein